MKHKPYPKYKESGIQWIGEIPEDWETNKIKHNVLPLEKSGVEASEGSEEGKYPFFTSSQIQNKFVEEFIFDKECLILGTGGGASVHYYKGKFSVSTDCLVLRKQKEIDMKFLYYQIFSNSDVLDDLGFWGMGLRHLQKYFLFNHLAYWPQEQTQQKIASFLDTKTSEIDQTIEKDKELIELLKEKRTALINYVVTKGLDPKAKMKDSGINWVGEIPEGWKLLRFKHVFAPDGLIRGPFGSTLKTEFFVKKGYKVYEQKNAIKNSINIGSSYVDSKKYNELIRFSVKEGDILMSCSGTIGKIVKVPKKFEKGIINQAMLIMRFNSLINLEYFQYLFFSDYIEKQITDNSMGSAMKNLVAMDEFKSTRILLPPKQEQSQIVEYLDKATSKIDQTINKIQEKITLMEEYKKSLIHHVVTGKVDVREAVA